MLRLTKLMLVSLLILAMDVGAFQKQALRILSTASKTGASSNNRLQGPGFGIVTTTFYAPSTSKTTNKSTTTTASTTTSILAYKFKNIDEMLHAFREEPVLVYFTSGTCGPCHLQKKELANVRDIVGAELAFKVLAVDTKKWPHVGTKFSIGKLPCLLVMKDKEVLLRLEGLTRAEELVEKVYTNTSFRQERLR